MSTEAEADAHKIYRQFGRPTSIATSATMRMIRNAYPPESIDAWRRIYS